MAKILGQRSLDKNRNKMTRTKEILKESEQNIRGLLEAAPDAMVLIDVAGKIIFLNSQTENLFGYRKEDLLGQLIEKLVPERFRAKHPAYRAEYFANPRVRPMGSGLELSGVRKDGTEFPVEISLSHLQIGKSRVAMAAVRDATQRKETEVFLRKAKEAAEAANRAKSDFLANMSHEIRTPMNGILGMTDLLADTELSPKQREYLGMVETSAETLMSLINDLLDFSKIEAGKLEPIVGDFELRETIGDTMKALGVRAHQKDLELNYQIGPDVPESLIGDAGRLQQVLVNLVGNAVKFTEAGEVVLRVDTMEQSGSDVVLHFSVSDTGIGIAQEKQHVIFAPFEQVDMSSTRRYGGSGLGLAISSRLVQMMGGRIWLESDLGRGSVFHFTGRFGVQRIVKTPTRVLMPRELRDVRVLVVDDNTTNRLILKEVLSDWNMKPTLADSGKTALAEMWRACAQGKPFPIVLLDVMMPEMDGFMAAAHIRATPEFSDSIVIMLSSSDRAEDLRRGEKLDVAGFLIKPVKHSELLATIYKALMRKTQDEPAAGSAPGTADGQHVPTGGLRILLAEDNIVNQKLAVLMLQRLGHVVVVANDGQEALEILAGQAFDLIFMDVQMPRMDGLEATLAIRRKEAGTGRHIPIIALTAHALKTDQDRCLAAGMDGYISKPFERKRIAEAIERFARGSRQSSSVPTRGLETVSPARSPRQSSAGDVEELLDQNDLLDRIAGDTSLLRELVTQLAKDYPPLAASIRSAIDSGDEITLKKVVHTLKGAISVFSAKVALKKVGELEQFGLEKGPAWAREQAFLINEEVTRLQAALNSLVE